MGIWLAQVDSDVGGFRQTVDSLARTPLSSVLLWAVLLTVLRLALFPLVSRTKGWLRGVFRMVNDAFDAAIYASLFVFLIIRPFVAQAYSIPSGSMVPTLLVDDYVVANKAIYRIRDPRRGEIVVFRPPVEATDSTQRDRDGDVNVDFVKRCIGVPGDVIEVRNNAVYRNHHLVDEDYKHFMTGDPPGQDHLYRDLTGSEVATAPVHNFKLVEYKGKVWPVLFDGDSVNDSELTALSYRVLNEDEATELANLPPAKVPPGHYLMMGDNRFNSFDGRSFGLVTRENIIARAECIWLPLARWRMLKFDPGSESGLTDKGE